MERCWWIMLLYEYLLSPHWVPSAQGIYCVLHPFFSPASDVHQRLLQTGWKKGNMRRRKGQFPGCVLLPWTSRSSIRYRILIRTGGSPRNSPRAVASWRIPISRLWVCRAGKRRAESWRSITPGIRRNRTRQFWLSISKNRTRTRSLDEELKITA